VNNYDFAIASHPHIELAHIGAKVSCRDERAQGVFRIKSARSPVSDRQHRMRHRRFSPNALIIANLLWSVYLPRIATGKSGHASSPQADSPLVKPRDDPYAGGGRR
jgi:hypothetical protein